MAGLVSIPDLMAAHLRSKSPEARTEGKILGSMFSKDVDEVSKGGVQDFMQGSSQANKLATAGDLTEDDAKLVKDTLRDLMQAKRTWAMDFYTS